MFNLTEFEIDVLNGIAYHEMSPANTMKPRDINDTGTYCWADTFSDKLTTPQVKGVLSSLVKKGLIHIDVFDHPADENVVSILPAGFAAWQANDDNRSD